MNHKDYMKEALLLAEKAYQIGEVPVGAVLVDKSGEIVSSAHNLKETKNNPTGHAELLAISHYAQKIDSWRLLDTKLYVTLEPCMMCAGAIWQSRVSEVIYGAKDPKNGFIDSIHSAFGEESKLNHKPKITSGILQDECSLILTNFFKERRQRK